MDDYGIIDALPDRLIQEFDTALDKIVDEKNKMIIKDEFLLNVMGRLINRPLVENPKQMVGNYLKREDMIKVMLDFFESVDKEFYDKAVKIVLGQNDKIKLNIYNRNKIKNFGEQDENGVQKYDIQGSAETFRGHTIVHSPLESDDYCTLQEVYTIVHEIAHLFDSKKEDTLPKMKDFNGKVVAVYKRNEVRHLLTEITAIAFEGMLSDYLLQKTSLSKSEIKYNALSRIRYSHLAAESIFLQLLFAKEKEKHGYISKKDIKEIFRRYKLKPDMAEYFVKTIGKQPASNLQDTTRYALAGLISPTIVQEYIKNKRHGVKLLKRYIECLKNNDFSGAFKVYKIRWNKRSIERLIQNVKRQEEIFMEKEEER